MTKRILAMLLCVLMLISVMSGCGQSAKPAAPADPSAPAVEAPAAEAVPETREFTDSCGRTVTIPYEIKSIAVSGPLTQTYVLPLCPELMAGFCQSFSDDTAKYIPAQYLNLPELGQLYGGKGTMDLEALLAAAPDVVVDVGEAKGSLASDMDALSEQTGIPFVHIDATVATANQAYRKLGELTGCTDKAEELAVWCETCYADIEAMMARIDADGNRRDVIYCLGDKGLNCLAEGSYHAETVNMLGKNVAELTDVVSSGAGNEIDLEQLILWNPDFIIFSYDSIYDSVADEPAWQQLDAVKNGNYVKTPYGPYGWLASPPAVQRYLGMIWLGALLYPDYVDYDIQAKVAEYYKLFYGFDMSGADYAELTVGAFVG